MQAENDKNSIYCEKALGECSEGGEPDDEPVAKEEGDSGIDANSQVTTLFDYTYFILDLTHVQEMPRIKNWPSNECSLIFGKFGRITEYTIILLLVAARCDKTHRQ